MQRVAVKAEALRSQALRRANAPLRRGTAPRARGAASAGTLRRGDARGAATARARRIRAGSRGGGGSGTRSAGKGGAPDAAGGGRGSFNGANLRQALAE